MEQLCPAQFYVLNLMLIVRGLLPKNLCLTKEYLNSLGGLELLIKIFRKSYLPIDEFPSLEGHKPKHEQQSGCKYSKHAKHLLQQVQGLSASILHSQLFNRVHFETIDPQTASLHSDGDTNRAFVTI